MKNCVKDKMDDSCAAQKHSGLGITEELSKSRQELSSLLHHSWVTPVKHKFANFQPQESTAVFTAKNLQASYCWRTQQSTKWQIKPCRGSALHCFSEMKPFHTRGEVEHGAKHSTAWGMLIILAKSFSQMSPIFTWCVCWKSTSCYNNGAGSHFVLQGRYCSIWASWKTHKTHQPDTENNNV